MGKKTFGIILVSALAVTVVYALAGRSQPYLPLPRFVRKVDWIGSGVWLKVDTHTHSTFSDGQHTIQEVVAQAERFGCDAVAITDHTDRNLQAGTDPYIQAIDQARQNHPRMIVLAGLEWNIPPWDGREHATVLLPDHLDEGGMLARFKQQFDGLGRWQQRPDQSDQALRWLAAQTATLGVRPVVIYNHPSRKQSSSRNIEEPITRWRKTNDLVIGFSGAPGHQRKDPIGSYRDTEQTVDRWDPAAARVGDAWDTLLQKGLDLWAARAPSDFHSQHDMFGDHWPGQFSETWVYAPSRSVSGILQAFRAGTFFAAHGHIVRNVVLSVRAPGLSRAAWPGEAIRVKANSSITTQIDMLVPSRDWTGHENRIDALELIAITPDNARIVANRPPNAHAPAMVETIRVPPGGLVLRARGRRVINDGPDLMFYTNPVRVLAEPDG